MSRRQLAQTIRPVAPVSTSTTPPPASSWLSYLVFVVGPFSISAVHLYFMLTSQDFLASLSTDLTPFIGGAVVGIGGLRNSNRLLALGLTLSVVGNVPVIQDALASTLP